MFDLATLQQAAVAFVLSVQEQSGARRLQAEDAVECSVGREAVEEKAAKKAAGVGQMLRSMMSSKGKAVGGSEGGAAGKEVLMLAWQGMEVAVPVKPMPGEERVKIAVSAAV